MNNNSTTSSCIRSDYESLHIHNLHNGFYSITIRGMNFGDSSDPNLTHKGTIEFPKTQLKTLDFTPLPYNNDEIFIFELTHINKEN